MNVGMFRFADIFCKLVKTQFYIARRQLLDNAINLYIWAFCSLVIMGYVMQQFGLISDYGCFQFATILGTVGLFQVYGNSFRAMIDFEGDRYIGYYLTLPLAPPVVWASMICTYMLIGIILTVLVLPLGKLLLFNSLSLVQVSWIKFAIILFLANIFFGVFTLAVTAYVGQMSKMENVWSRFIFPLWFLGGFQFSWTSVYALSQPLAYVLLCNPILFVMEGMRVALLGQQDCLPWGMCCLVLCGFTIVGWVYAQYKMKRLLDYV